MLNILWQKPTMLENDGKARIFLLARGLQVDRQRCVITRIRRYIIRYMHKRNGNFLVFSSRWFIEYESKWILVRWRRTA